MYKRANAIGVNRIFLTLFMLFFTCQCSAKTESNEGGNIQEKLSLPLIDYTSIDSYWTLKSISDSGYFKVGRRYVHAPRVEWVPVDGVSWYKIVLLQHGEILGVTEAGMPPVYAEKGWDKIKPGKASVAIIGYGTDGQRAAISRLFPFYVAPNFDKKVSAERKRPYLDAAYRTFNALYEFRLPPQTPAPDSGPGSRIKHPVVLTAMGSPNGWVSLSWPNLHDWCYVAMCSELLKTADSDLKPKIISFADSVGKHIMMCRLSGEDNVYSGMIRGCVDWNGESVLAFTRPTKEEADKYRRLIEPAKCGYSGEALVRIYEMTGDTNYLDAAEAIANCLMRTQLPDGSWPARVDGKTGEVIGEYSTSAIAVASFMDRLNEHRPSTKMVECSKRALNWTTENPFKTFGWVLNYDDSDVLTTSVNPYIGLSNWDLFASIKYLEHQPGNNWQKIAKEQLRWNDNHFVFYGDDPLLAYDPYYPTCGEQGNPGSFTSEKSCWLPMDFHTANWGLALLSAYKMSGDEEYLEKAKAAGNALTQYQLDTGATITWMQDKKTGLSTALAGNNQEAHGLWPAAWALSAAFWAKLEADFGQ